MKLLIAGSRNITDQQLVLPLIDNKYYLMNLLKEIEYILSGKAKGADHLGEIWATYRNVLIKEFPANWNAYGKRAGFIRNEEMVKDCTEAMIFWDKESRGTKHTIDLLLAMQKPFELIIIKDGKVIEE